MNRVLIPKLGEYLIFTKDWVATDDTRHVLTVHCSLYRDGLHQRMVHFNYHPKKGDWFAIGSMIAPRRSWPSWKGECLISLKLELSKPDRIKFKQHIHALALAPRDNVAETITLLVGKVTVSTRTLSVYSGIINELCISTPSREIAKALSKQILNPEDKELSRWDNISL